MHQPASQSTHTSEGHKTLTNSPQQESGVNKHTPSVPPLDHHSSPPSRPAPHIPQHMADQHANTPINTITGEQELREQIY